MNTSLPPLSPETEAAVLFTLAFALFSLSWIISIILKWCADTATSKDKLAMERLRTTAVLIEIVFFMHLLNIGDFLFIKANWQSLASWQVRLLPDHANAVLMLLSYYLVIAICKVTWKDMASQLRVFANRTRSASHTD